MPSHASSLSSDRPQLSFHRSHRRLTGQLIVVVVTVGMFALLLARNGNEMRTSLSVARLANPLWFSLALLCECIALGLIGLRLKIVLGRLGHPLRYRRVLGAYLRRTAIATVLPFGAAPAAAVFAKDLGRDDVPIVDGLYGLGLSSLAGGIGTLIALAPAAIWVLGPRLLATVVIAGVAIVALSIAFVRGRSGSLRTWHWLPLAVRSAIEDARAHQVRPRHLAGPVLLASLSTTSGILALACSLRAVQDPIAIKSLLQARAVGTIAAAIAPIFQGTGAVEGSMAVILQNAGASQVQVLAGTLLFRANQVWLPVMIGFFLWIVAFGPAVRIGRSHIRLSFLRHDHI